MNLNTATPALEVAALRALAEENYEADGGVMCECFDQAGYEDLVNEHGTASAAWAAHLIINEARRESCGYYERF